MPALLASPRLFFAAHLVLALAMAFWRVLEATPGIAARDGGSFSTSPAGRALALVCLALSLPAIAVVLVQGWRRRREPLALALTLACAAALAWRREVDVFDLSYTALAIGAGVWWFTLGQRRTLAA